MPELALGTAQLGMDYGVASGGRPSLDDVREILEAALGMGIRCFDTAPAYGESERAIGSFLRESAPPVLRIITKIARMPHGMSPRDLHAAVFASLGRSRENLRLDVLDDVLIHSAEDLLHYGQALVDVLEEAIGDGLVRRIGLSVYEPSEAECGAAFGSLTVVQHPFNVFDTRFRPGGAPTVKGERFARSILLQGLLLLDADAAERAVTGAGACVGRFRHICSEQSTEPVNAAVGFASATSGADYLIVGVESVRQLEEIEASVRNPLAEDTVNELQAAFQDVPACVRDPRHWGLVA